MKISIAQINPLSGNISKNTLAIEEILRDNNIASFFVFPELSVCGSPLYAQTHYSDFLDSCRKASERIASLGRYCIVGLPTDSGKNKPFNSLVLYANGEQIAISSKKNLSDMERNSYEEGRGYTTVILDGQTIAFGFFEDIEDFTSASKIDILVCCAASAFDETKHQKHITILQRTIAKHQILCGLFVNRVGGEGHLVYAGGSFAMNQEGKICEEIELFQPLTLTVDSCGLKQKNAISYDRYTVIRKALVLAISDYFRKNNIPRAFVGLSGGIDSALVVVLAVEALGKENVEGILLPSMYSSDHSIADAKKSAENLGITYRVIPIEESFTSILKTLDPTFEGTEPNLAEENIQARIRGLLLMAIANKFGGMVLNTSNKSESAVGYGTLYGDMCGGMAVIGDLYKKDVWGLSYHINKEREIIPLNSIIKEPSAELRFDQKDSDSLPPYDVLDAILLRYIEQSHTAEEIIAEGYDATVVKRTIHLVRMNEWKRRQAPPPIKISPVTFGVETLFPIA